MLQKQNIGRKPEGAACGNFRNRGCLFAGKSMLLMGIVHFILCAWAWAEDLSGAEYRVKAGFIYHFARFTQWPPDAFADEESPIMLCIAAKSGADILLPLRNKIIRKRRIETVPYPEPDAEPQICHILFVTASEEDRFPSLPPGPVLTIGETDAFGRKGGIIRFFMEKDRLRFAVNLKAARRAGLQLSSQLLMSAEIATEAP
ncbi:MAG: YfiR family protein [Desulfobacterales bacterium]